ITWCEVPGGEFIYQDGEKQFLPTFYIAKYPVTYRQYEAFLEDEDGYQKVRWWEGLHEEGLAQQKEGPGEQRFKFWNHPRDDVSYYDAMAFCRWLTAKLPREAWPNGVGKDWMIRLPTEQEWEKAARGTDGRVYPYGNEFEA